MQELEDVPFHSYNYFLGSNTVGTQIWVNSLVMQNAKITVLVEAQLWHSSFLQC